MTTPLESIYGWFIPAFIICLGLFFIKSGYASTERLKAILRNIYNRFLKNNEEETLIDIDRKTNDEEVTKKKEIQEVIPYCSKLFNIIAVVFGFFLGMNSGMFGANSGMIIVLALIILYGYPIKKSIGTALSSGFAIADSDLDGLLEVFCASDDLKIFRWDTSGRGYRSWSHYAGSMAHWGSAWDLCTGGFPLDR